TFCSGESTHGHVYQVFSEQTGLIAAKVVKDSDLNFNEWQNSIKLTKQMSNPFALKYDSINIDKKFAVAQMEYANLGNLRDLIESENALPVSVIRVIMKQLFEGLRIMHEKGLIHRNIQEKNIYLHSPIESGRVVVKIADFGLVKAQKYAGEQILVSSAGAPQYQPPELILANEHEEVKADAKIDVWSAGIVLYRLATKCFPFKSTSIEAINTFMSSRKLTRPPDIYDDYLWDFLTNILSFDRKSRPTSADALQHLFFVCGEARTDVSISAIQLAHESLSAKMMGDTRHKRVRKQGPRGRDDQDPDSDLETVGGLYQVQSYEFWFIVFLQFKENIYKFDYFYSNKRFSNSTQSNWVAESKRKIVDSVESAHQIGYYLESVFKIKQFN
ncbi:MAG: putative AGC family protein kinase, partial [Streblomastix strix]